MNSKYYEEGNAISTDLRSVETNKIMKKLNTSMRFLTHIRKMSYKFGHQCVWNTTTHLL